MLSRHATAAFLAAIYALMLLLAFPGLDALGNNLLQGPRAQRALAEDVPEALRPVALEVARLNVNYRVPVVRLFSPLERTLRIRQNWSVYRGGPQTLGRLEVRVDGDLVYRSADDDHRWRRAQLSNRHVRPAVEGYVDKGRQSKNWRGMARLLATWAQQDFPGVQWVEIRSLRGRFPGTKLKTRDMIVLRAPDFEPPAVAGDRTRRRTSSTEEEP